MSTVQQRILHFAGSTVGIIYNGTKAAELVDFLYRDIPDIPGASPTLTYHLNEVASGHFSLYRETTCLYKGSSEGILAELLLGDSCYHLATTSHGGLLFHAAAVAYHNQGLLMPGTIGAGKTTLTAWLVATMKINYLSDEMVFVPKKTGALQPFTRPLNLKIPSKGALQPYVNLEQESPLLLRSPGSYLLSPQLLNPTTTPRASSLRWILFPHYAPEHPSELSPLSKAQTGLALMECLVNARNLPDHGFSEISRITKLSSGYRLTYSNFTQIETSIQALLGS